MVGAGVDEVDQGPVDDCAGRDGRPIDGTGRRRIGWI